MTQEEITQSTASEAYASLRSSIGSQGKIAPLLGIDVTTLSRRERPGKAVSREAVMALLYIREHGLIDGASANN
jgi:hypothetical protein